MAAEKRLPSIMTTYKADSLYKLWSTRKAREISSLMDGTDPADEFRLEQLGDDVKTAERARELLRERFIPLVTRVGLIKIHNQAISDVREWRERTQGTFYI